MPKRLLQVGGGDENEAIRYFEALPDEVLGLVIRAAFNDRLPSLYDYNELLSVQRISSRFSIAVTEHVLPNITFLGSPILRRISLDQLRSFPRLAVFGAGTDKAWNKKGSSYDVRILPNLPLQQVVIDHRHLDTLSLITFYDSVDQPKNLSLTLDIMLFQSLANLRVLRMRNVPNIKDEHVSLLSHLAELRIELCRLLSHACLLPLVHLQKLSLKQCKDKFTDLTTCAPNLAELELQDTVVTGESFRMMTRLTVLVVDDAAPEFDDGLLVQLTTLRALDVKFNRTSEMRPLHR